MVKSEELIGTTEYLLL